MKNHKTLVRFLYNEKSEDLFAYFPQHFYNKRLYGRTMKTCYSHVGQHSGCHIDYIKESRPATPDEYADLKRELEGQGYELRVCK